ncbi:MAG: heme biosynthesis protein HemY [Burkholderiales bacterium]|nr:heme biosynthesis protein HemY [Burkholderiales bacterium]
MRGLLWVLAVFAAAVGLALFLEGEGYVIVVTPPWRMELSLVLAVLLLLGAFALLYLVARLVSHTLALPAQVRDFRRRLSERGARRSQAAALQARFEGRFSRVEKLAADAWTRGESRALAALVAARAAHRRGDRVRRDQWLERAATADPEWRNATLALEAELLVEERQFDKARSVLQALHAGGLRHLATMQLLMRCEHALGNWAESVRLARVLEKREALSHEVAASIVTAARVAQIERAAGDSEALAKCWRSIPAKERENPRIAAPAARGFLATGDVHAAQRLLEEALARNWESELALVYGECRGGDAIGRVHAAERWLTAHPQDPWLLLALGRLCVQCELWGKAQSYLEASLAVQPLRETHLAYAELLERLSRTEEANRQFRAAAGLGAGSPARSAN